MKHVKDSSPAEQAANLAALIRGAKPAPPPIITPAEPPLIRGSSNPSPSPSPADPKPKHARDMSEAERSTWISEHMKRTR
jgi:hypothetical protein